MKRYGSQNKELITMELMKFRFFSLQADPSETRLWSDVVTATARTLPRVPSTPPRVAQGSFEVVGGMQERRVYLYWQQIPDTARNGPDFSYVVTEVSEAGKIR